MNHSYFTALSDGAGLAAELAACDGEPRVYLVGIRALEQRYGRLVGLDHRLVIAAPNYWMHSS